MAQQKPGAWGSVLDWLGGIAAFLTVLTFALLAIHAKWAFLPEELYNVLVIVETWAPLVVVGITAFEFCSGKTILLKIIFAVLFAVVILSMFFSSTWEQVVGVINGNH